MVSQDSRLGCTPVTVLTGFLGAGKTTILNRILATKKGRRIAIVENEFGPVAIDNDLVLRTAERIITIADGCVCCTVRGDLIDVLRALKNEDRNFDHIVIETTGLADPRPLLRTLLDENTLLHWLGLVQVITVVDAMNLEQHLPRYREVAEQIACADRIVVTKLDIAPHGCEGRIEALVKSVNPTAELVRVHHPASITSSLLDVSHKFMAWCGAKYETQRCFASPPHDTHPGPALGAVGIKLIGELNPPLFYRWWGDFLFTHRPLLLRTKALLSVCGVPSAIVMQGVAGIVSCSEGPKWPLGARRCHMALIGYRLSLEELDVGLRSCLVPA